MKKKRIGILGGGQLARMSAMAAVRMGFEIFIYDKEENSPAGMIAGKEFIGSVDDKVLLSEFADSVDVVTLENEFIDYQDLEFIEKRGKEVIPSSKVISLIQDKLLQKQTLQNAGILVPVFIEIDRKINYAGARRLLGEKFVLKSRKMGYDGYGNHLVTSEESYLEGIEKLSGRGGGLMAEKFVTFEKELAIMVVKTKNEIKTYPVVETIQKNHICYLVLAPVDLDINMIRKAESIGKECVNAINGEGIFGVEMFLSGDMILVNEIAPRPHNSGHYSIEGCITSQFENHIRAAVGLPLGSTEMRDKCAVMVNLLGKKNDDLGIENYEDILSDEKIHLHYYCKKASRPGRKMGHITITGENPEELADEAVKLEEKIII